MREDEVALIDHTAGVVRPERSVKAFLENAEKHGAKILYHTKVIGWKETLDGVEVSLDDGTVILGK